MFSIRLVGTVYFSKHLASFNTLYGHETPIHSYNSVDSTLSPTERHKKWIEHLTKIIADRIKAEEDRIPSYTALWRHWLRSCWGGSLWLNAPLPDPYSSLIHPENSGWLLLTDGKYIIDWEDPNFISKTERNITYLIKGCRCKGGCKTNRCGCKKQGSHCGPGCECHECTNLPLAETTSVQAAEEAYIEEISDVEYDGDSDSDGLDTDMTDTDNLASELITEPTTAYIDLF